MDAKDHAYPWMAAICFYFTPTSKSALKFLKQLPSFFLLVGSRPWQVCNKGGAAVSKSVQLQPLSPTTFPKSSAERCPNMPPSPSSATSAAGPCSTGGGCSAQSTASQRTSAFLILDTDNGQVAFVSLIIALSFDPGCVFIRFFFGKHPPPCPLPRAKYHVPTYLPGAKF